MVDKIMTFSLSLQGVIPKSAMEGAIKFKDRALFYLSELSMYNSNLTDNQATFLMTVIFGLAASAVILYFAFIAQVLRPFLKKFGVEFKSIRFSVLKLSMICSNLVILPLESPVIRGIFGAIFPSAVVKQLQKSDEYPSSKIEIGTFSLRIQMGSLTGKFRSDTEQSFLMQLKYIIGSFIPRPLIVIKMSNVILTVEKCYLAPAAPSEFAHGEKLPYSIPSAEEYDPRLPIFDQDIILDYLRNDEINDAELTTFWIERWLNHTVKTTNNANEKAKENQIDDEKINSTMRYICQVILHSISIHLENSSLVISGADSDFVKSTRENHSATEANLMLAKLPKSRRGLSIIGAQTIEIAFSSDDECNLFLCCAGVQVQIGIPLKTRDKDTMFSWHAIVHPFDVVVELKGLIAIFIWALNYEHDFDVKSIDLLITVTELVISLSPAHLHTLILHLDDFIDANSPFNQWFQFMHRSHMNTLGRVENKDKLAYCESYHGMKVKKTKSASGRKLLSATEIKDLEKKMTRYEIMSLRCFAMMHVWQIPKESKEFVDYLQSSKTSIVESTDPLKDSPTEILIPFQQNYPTDLHALVTLVRCKNALLSALKIRYVAHKLRIDLPSDTEEFSGKTSPSKRSVSTSLTSTGVYFELEKRDALLHAPHSLSLHSLRTVLKTALTIKEIEWTVVGFSNQGKKLPTLENDEYVGIIYKQKVPTNELALKVELKMDVSPTLRQDTTISFHLICSDLVIVVNPIPLLSALQTLLEASHVPLHIIDDNMAHSSNVANGSPKKLEIVSSEDELEEDSHIEFIDTSVTDIGIKVEQVSIIFLVNASSICRDILHFDIRDIGIALDSKGKSGVLTLATKPFDLCPGQVIILNSKCFDWKLLPFKPIISIKGVRLITTVTECNKGTGMAYEIDVKQGVECVLICASPLTLAALNRVMDSLQPFVAPNKEYADQLKAQNEAALAKYRANVQRQRQELINIFNAIDKDQSHTLQDYELAELVHMLLEQSSDSRLPSTRRAKGLTSAEFNRQKSFLLSTLDSKGVNEISLTDLEMTLFQMANKIDDCNLKSEIGTTGISYYDNVHKSKFFLSGPTLRKLVQFDDLKEFTALHHVFQFTGHDDIFTKTNYPSPTSWAEGGIEKFWNFYTTETGCSRHSLNGQDVKSVQQKLVRSLCNYEFAKFCWKSLVQQQLCSKTPHDDDDQEVTLWLLDNDHKYLMYDGIIDLLLKHLRDSSMESNQATNLSSSQHYLLSLNIVVDTVEIRFGSSNAENALVQVEICQTSMSSSALLSDSGWFTSTSEEDSSHIRLRSIISVKYLNTKHDHIETAIEPYPCYGLFSYKVNMSDRTLQNEGDTESSSFSMSMDCPRVLNIDLGLNLLDTVSVLLNAFSPLESQAEDSLFSSCQKILFKNSTGRDMKVSTADADQCFATVGVDKAVLFPLTKETLSIYTEKYKLIQNIELSPYQPMMFPLLRRKQKGKSTHWQSHSGFGSFLTLVPKSDSFDKISIEARSCVTIQTHIPVNIRIVRLPKNLGHLRKRGMKSVIDLTKKNLMPALTRLVKGALIVFERNTLLEGNDCSVPVDLFNSSHYYALLIQDIAEGSRKWRDPVLLSQDYLFNTMSIPEVSRSHSLSGICVKKKRLNVKLSSQARRVNSNYGVHHRSTWDSCIMIVPTFILSNSMPCALSFRVWQMAEANIDTLLFDQLPANEEEEEDSDDENQSSFISSSFTSNMDLDQYHNPPDVKIDDYYSEHLVERGCSIRLSGINLQKRLYLQAAQQNKVTVSISGAKHMWSSPVLINLKKLRTGANKKGSVSLPRRIIDLGDEVDALVDASIDVETGMPTCLVYSPYWIVNKTGMKMEYKVSGDPRKFIDSGVGGLPVMFHGGHHNGSSSQTNAIFKKASSEIQCIPIECPKYDLVSRWWDDASNGALVLRNDTIKCYRRNKQVRWSEEIEMDAAGTTGTINCDHIALCTSIDSMAGAYYKTNLITLCPRFILKNMLHIAVTAIPLMGSQQDVIRFAKKLRYNPDLLSNERVDLFPYKSTVLYSFHRVSHATSSIKWVAFTVNAARLRLSFKGKWHLIPMEMAGSMFYGEHDGLQNTICGILEVKTHRSDGGSMVVSISHCSNPPFIIENRSNTHFLQFAQDDDEATAFELPPMHSAGYTWDSPFGNHRLRATVVRKCIHHCTSLDEQQSYFIDEKHELVSTSPKKKKQSSLRRSKGEDENNTNSVADGTLSSCTSNISQKNMNVFDTDSRSYSMKRIGRKKKLPTNLKSHWIHAHLRIIAGAKILSFNDSDYLAQQVESGIMRKGGSFKNAFLKTTIEGMQLTILDTFPKELLAITIRDVQIIKPEGSIEAALRVRHFQVDAMLPSARYPIIIQPLPLGVDRRKIPVYDGAKGHLDKKDCYWLKHAEKPVPVLEIVGSYVPQTSMVWIPNLYVMLSPCQVNVDVEYLLGTIVMPIIDLLSNSDIFSGSTTYCPTERVNAPLKFITQGQRQSCNTYLEKLYIAPVYFDIELDIKEESQEADEGVLTLNTIARATNSAAAAGILAWVLNVGANFAHVSPKFKYSHISYSDKYCDILDLAKDIVVSYVIRSIQQSYKVIFSMHLLGDPSLLAHEWKTGLTDLVAKTHEEVKAGGNGGIGKGFVSFLQHAVGGTFFWMGKLSGSWAKTLDAAVSNHSTSTHLKPDFASYRNRPKNVHEGIIQGTEFVGKTIIYGVAGLIGNPYRGMKSTGISGFTKGAVSGVAGLASVIFVAPLGFIAKTSDGLGAQTRCLEIGVINSRCRPIRSVSWGSPIMDKGLSYMKAIGIRVHCVRYQKVRKQPTKGKEYSENDDEMKRWKSSKELKRMKTAEERRHSPPRKVITLLYNKNKHFYSTNPITPKLLVDQPQGDILSHYAIVFEDTIVIRVPDMQLSDEITIQLRNNMTIKSAAMPLGTCKMRIGDIYSYILNFHHEKMVHHDSTLASNVANKADDLFNNTLNEHAQKDFVVPVPQEYSLYRTPKSITPNNDTFDLVRQELVSIQRDEEERLQDKDDDSYVSPESAFNIGKKFKKNESSGSASAHEKLFGNISLSFFPINW